MFCSQCGTQLHDQAAFCHSCGSKVQGGAQPAAQQQAQQTTPAQPQQTTPQQSAQSEVSQFAQQAGDAVKNGAEAVAQGFNSLKTNVENSEAFKNAQNSVENFARSEQFVNATKKVDFKIIGIVVSALMALCYFIPLFSIGASLFGTTIAKSFSMLNMTFGAEIMGSEVKGSIFNLLFLAFPVATLLCLLLVKKERVAWIVSLVMGVLALLLVIIWHASVSRTSYSDYLHLGIGFYLYILLAIALIVVAILGMMKGMSKTTATQQAVPAQPAGMYTFGMGRQATQQSAPAQQFQSAPVTPTYPTVAPSQPTTQQPAQPQQTTPQQQPVWSNGQQGDQPSNQQPQN